jgi:subtilisin-like proprotein convertase family protein
MRRTTTVVAAGVLIIGMAATAAQAKGADDPETRAFTQVAALQQVKKSLTRSERKLDGRLALELRLRQDKTVAAAAPKVSTGVKVATNGTTRVTIDATKVDDGLLSRLRGVGAGIRYPSPRTGTVLVDAPLSALTTIASWPDVTRVRTPSGAMTARMTTPEAAAKAAAESKEAKAARLAGALRAAEAKAAPAGAAAAAVDQGSVVSEGDRTHAADTARARYKVTGIGVKVCVLSDGVDSLDASVASGDLPPDVDVLPGQEGDGDEGTAMLEIIHDLAPSAKLGFATAFISEESFADNILALRFDAHCDIIVDDVLYFHEDPFQDGLIAQSVNAVTADGAFYFSSAGNEGNTIDGTAGNYEGDFVDSGRGVGKFAGQAHDFDPGPGVQVFNPLSPNSDNVPVTLWWSDPLGASSNDYDLYAFDSDGNVVAVSFEVQDGDDDPFEILGTALFLTGQRLAVVKFSGEDRYFQLSALRGRFADSPDGLTGFSTPGVTRGHAAAAQAFAVAAAPAHNAFGRDLEVGDPPNPAGPYPDVFTRKSAPERFTSDGPRRVFYEADGTPITPGDVSSTGGAVRQKPEITAADGTASSVFGFSPFFGTSAAAPHAAAIAALALSGNPGMTNAEIRAALTSSALDLKPAGVDNRSGYGVIRADRLLRTTGATPQPLVQAGEPTVTPVSGDGDAFLEPGEQASISVPAVNVGDGTATGVSVVLTATDPLVTLRPPARSYGNIAAGASKSRSFTLTLDPAYPVGKPVALSAKVTFAGVLSPTTDSLSVPVGQPSTQVQTFAYDGPVVPIPDADPTGVSATIDVSGVGYASGLTFSIDGTECSATVGATGVGLDHTFVGDLVGTLTAPDGTTATLFSRSGGTGNNMCQTVFDDAATTPFDGVSSSLNPFTGSWQPLTPLAALRASPVDGTWTFHVADRAGADTGNIRAFSLHITGFEAH